MRACCLTLVTLTLVLLTSCQRSAPPSVTHVTPASVRAERRAFDGAPPVIPHGPLGPSCTACHTDTARDVPGIGFAPPNPHRKTPGMSASSRCQQCHVFQSARDLFDENHFRPLLQDLRRGDRLYASAPPVLPHGIFMREDCTACHAGSAVRPEIRCSHAERVNCLQCHARSATFTP